MVHLQLRTRLRLRSLATLLCLLLPFFSGRNERNAVIGKKDDWRKRLTSKLYAGKDSIESIATGAAFPSMKLHLFYMP